MHGRILAITERVITVAEPGDESVVDDVETWTRDHGLEFSAVESGESIESCYDRDVATLGVAIGGDGVFLEAIQEFAPRSVPVMGVETADQAFLTRVDPDDVGEALEEAVRGRARIADRQQFQVRAPGVDGVGINDVIVRAVPPSDPTERKITRVHAFVDGEYVGEYEGTGLVVGTPTGSTGIALSARGPIHYPEDNFTLQLVPLSTHRMGARPLVVGSSSEVTLVAEEPANLLVDGGRDQTRLGPEDVVTVTGSESLAHVVRTSYDDGFFDALSRTLGWGIRDADDDGPVDVVGARDRNRDREESFLERALRIATEAAESAAEPLRNLHGQVESIEYKTSKTDIVTEADYRAEHIITTVIENEFPAHNVRSEEDVQRDRGSEYTWLIDPLDGTGNFAHGNPNYAISIALLDGETPVMGVVFSPETRELFAAIDGGTAYEDEVAISTTDRDRLDESMLLSGYDPDGSFLTRFYDQARGVRRLGSAALNLCYLASGSADAVWEYDTYPWDVAAGVVIARAAGAKLTDESGNPFRVRLDRDEERAELLGTNGPLHDAVLDHLHAGDGDMGHADDGSA